MQQPAFGPPLRIGARIGARMAAILVLAGSLAIAGCETAGVDEDGNPVVSSDGAGNSYSFFWDQSDHLTELTAAGKLDEAAKIFAGHREFFDRDRAKYNPRLKVLTDAINKREAAKLNSAFEKLDGVEWPAPAGRWPDIEQWLKSAGAVNDAYRARPLLMDVEFMSPTARSLNAEIAALAKRIRDSAADQFQSFNHFGDKSFFAIYPARLDQKQFMAEHFGAIRSRLAGAGTSELKKFAANYPKENVSEVIWREVSEFYLGAILPGKGNKLKFDLATVMQALTAVKKLGFEPKSVPGIKIAFVEVTSKSLLKDGQIEFPAEIVGDLPVEMVKADLDSALSQRASKAADYLIVFDVALATTRRRITSKRSMPARLLAGYRVEPNPEYNFAQTELNQAQLEMQTAQMHLASTNASYCDGLGCIGKIIAQMRHKKNIAAKRKEIESAKEKLRDTPLTVKIPVYKEYDYDLAVIKGTKLMTVHYYVIDREKQTYFKSTFDVEEKKTFNVAYSIHSKDPERKQHLESVDTDARVSEWEEAAVSIRLSRLVRHYLNNREQSKPLISQSALRKEMLRDKNKALAKIAATRFDARPLDDPRFDSVVVVYNNNKGSLGTGFFIKPDVVLTNWHVVDGAKFVEMKMYDKQETFGKIIAQDIRLDLALVKVQSRGKPVKFYTRKTLKLGETSEAIGHPRGLEFSITRGIVSAIRRRPTIHLDGAGKKVLFIQTDAPINPGNSGGPLFLGDKVIGVNSWKMTGEDVGGLNFSVHYSEVIDFLRDYLPGFQPGAGG